MSIVWEPLITVRIHHYNWKSISAFIVVAIVNIAFLLAMIVAITAAIKFGWSYYNYR